jgi:hypothetical protein
MRVVWLRSVRRHDGEVPVDAVFDGGEDAELDLGEAPPAARSTSTPTMRNYVST